MRESVHVLWHHQRQTQFQNQPLKQNNVFAINNTHLAVVSFALSSVALAIFSKKK